MTYVSHASQIDTVNDDGDADTDSEYPEYGIPKIVFVSLPHRIRMGWTLNSKTLLIYEQMNLAHLALVKRYSFPFSSLGGWHAVRHISLGMRFWFEAEFMFFCVFAAAALDILAIST